LNPYFDGFACCQSSPALGYVGWALSVVVQSAKISNTRAFFMVDSIVICYKDNNFYDRMGNIG
jgi:hypothetical protein